LIFLNIISEILYLLFLFNIYSPFINFFFRYILIVFVMIDLSALDYRLDQMYPKQNRMISCIEYPIEPIALV